MSTRTEKEISEILKRNNIVLGYWKIRGLAQPIRYFCEFHELKYEEVYYEVQKNQDGSWNRDDWVVDKEKYCKQVFDFANLPYLVDGNVRLTQSSAILRYLSRKVDDFSGLQEDELIRLDLIDSQITDYGKQWSGLCYNPKFKELESSFADSVKIHLKQFETFLSSRSYLVSDKKPLFVDFKLYELLDQQQIWKNELLKDFPTLLKYYNRMNDLKAIKTYIASDKYIKHPVNNLMASWK